MISLGYEESQGSQSLGDDSTFLSGLNHRLLFAFPFVFAFLSSLLDFNITILPPSLGTLIFEYGLQIGTHFW